MSRFVVKTRADSPELRRAAMAIEQAAWSSLGFLNYTRAHFEFYQQLLEEHSDCQLCLVDEETGYPVAVGNCVPLACDFNNLPPEGWDWIVESAAQNGGKQRNAIGALAISVPNIHRGKGVARRLIEEFRALAERKGFDGVIAPVRPSEKHRHPFTSIDDYIAWADEKGRLYDPWLRSHSAAGGKMIKPARRSMVVEEPVGFWEMWTGRSFEQSGEYAVEGGLVPVHMDLDQGVGRYVEPNVWFAYAA
ncbi:MAG: GNAT family N-acetyltransferase [Hyphomonadaceae bacterium]|nr:GNAT family N-acetyltransferase [Hyphomonadaceae bacterium]